MRELDAPADREQPGVHRCIDGRHVDLEGLGGRVEQDRIPERLGGRGKDEELRIKREAAEPSYVALFDLPGDRMVLWKTESASEFRRTPGSWELEQSQWVAVALGDDLIANDRIEWPDQVLEQQGAGIAVSERADQQLGQSAENIIADARPGGGDECHGLGEETTSDEAEDLAGRLIQPLRVLNDAHERLLLGRLDEEGQRSDPNQEPTGRRTFPNPEHRRQRIVLSRGEAIDEVEHRPTELMKPAVGELHL
jgi:hypothetical protein